MAQDVFSFAFIADAQIGMNSPSGLEGPASDKERLDRAIAVINDSDVRFVIWGGDQINNAAGEQAVAQLDVFEGCLSRLSVPHYGVIGNHEQGDPTQSWPYIERGLPIRFTFSYERAFFVGINALWLRGDVGEDYLKQEWDALEAAFAEARADCEQRFVVMHWPLFSVHPAEEDDYWNMPNRAELIDVFKKHHVSCVLSGHWQQDIDATWHGIPLITSIGTSLPLQYPEELSFKIVTVFEGGWSIRRVSVGET